MDLSVVIVNWNAVSHLTRCLDSISHLSEDVDEIVVVDNHSSDASCQRVGEYSRVLLIANQENRGFGPAANQGIARTRSRFVLLINSDTRVLPASVRKLYEAIESNSNSAIACGSLVRSDGFPQTSFQFRSLPTFSSVLLDVSGLDELLTLFRKKTPAPLKSGFLPCSVQPAAAYWMVRRGAWEALKGFDPRFWPAWFEDVDFCKRLESTEWRVLFCEEAPALHAGGVSLPSLGHRQFTRVFYTNLKRYLRKHHPYVLALLWFPIQCGSLVRQFLATPIQAVKGS